MEKIIDYRLVDLGLPSGLKWADRNVSAERPEDFGDYFAWGETEPRGEDWWDSAPYDWAHAPFNEGSNDFDEAHFNAHWQEWFTDKSVLKPEYDAAHVVMGGKWRMPTYAEIQELIACTAHNVGKMDGVYGMRFTSKVNGNSIFMPFSGYRYDSDASVVGGIGYVWSSSLYAGDAYYSHFLRSDSGGNANVDIYRRYYGFAVRGVHE